jgi:hypothetical protein
METKTLWQSKTVWFNVLSLVIGGAGYGAGALSAYPEVVCALVIIQAIGNLILRRVTKTAIA